jgi:hypothetical protein
LTHRPSPAFSCPPRSGAQRNMTLYAELMKATGKDYLVENCHWGKCDASMGDASSCPTRPTTTSTSTSTSTSATPDWCPFNFYRTSGDISASWRGFYRNLQVRATLCIVSNILGRSLLCIIDRALTTNGVKRRASSALPAVACRPSGASRTYR